LPPLRPAYAGAGRSPKKKDIHRFREIVPVSLFQPPQAPLKTPPWHTVRTASPETCRRRPLVFVQVGEAVLQAFLHHEGLELLREAPGFWGVATEFFISRLDLYD
jgi:hypothetical protein